MEKIWNKIMFSTHSFGVSKGKEIINFFFPPDTPNEWVLNMLDAFNIGDIRMFESLADKWKTQPDLLTKETQLREKIRLLCLMEVRYVMSYGGEESLLCLMEVRRYREKIRLLCLMEVMRYREKIRLLCLMEVMRYREKIRLLCLMEVRRACCALWR